jgi:hypothetical protein
MPAQLYFGGCQTSACSPQQECQPEGDACSYIGIMTTKVGEQFSVTLAIPADPSVSWTGIVGYSQIRDSSGALLYDFGTVPGAVDGSGNATIIFVAPGAGTVNWTPESYYVDFSFEVVGSFGPNTTGTYKLIVCAGVTVPP